jgi:hypothetical protein
MSILAGKIEGKERVALAALLAGGVYYSCCKAVGASPTTAKVAAIAICSGIAAGLGSLVWGRGYREGFKQGLIDSLSDTLRQQLGDDFQSAEWLLADPFEEFARASDTTPVWRIVVKGVVEPLIWTKADVVVRRGLLTRQVQYRNLIAYDLVSLRYPPDDLALHLPHLIPDLLASRSWRILSTRTPDRVIIEDCSVESVRQQLPAVPRRSVVITREIRPTGPVFVVGAHAGVAVPCAQVRTYGAAPLEQAIEQAFRALS